MVVSPNYNLIPYPDHNYQVLPYIHDNMVTHQDRGNIYDATHRLQYSDADQVGLLVDIYA